MKTNYEVLGVDKGVSSDEIKKAYRKLSMQWHPDKNLNNKKAEERYKEITSAYTILSDPKKRKEYDFSLNNPFGGGSNMGDISDLLKTFFGSGGGPGGGLNGFGGGGFPPGFPPGFGRGGPNVRIFTDNDSHASHMFFPGMDMEKPLPAPIVKKISISLKDAYTGITVPVSISRWRVYNNKKIYEDETIYIKIPPGIDNDEIINHKGKGHIIDNHTKGHVKIHISIKKHDLFIRDGIDLIYTKNITLKEALCGFSIEIMHLNSKSYKINNTDVIIHPSFIKSVSNHGMKRNGMAGDLIIKFNIKFPDSLEPNVIEQLKQLL